MKDAKKNIRFTLKLLLVLTVALLIVFSFYSSLELVEHHCTGEDCPVCHFIIVCRSFVGVFFLSSIVAGVLTILVAVKKLLAVAKSFIPTVSPVCLGVKLNN
ncbi:MAG: hypothetical protein IJU49_08470 [Lachnospiraceae bacterium]|nr:hypothetical protein [Lachnospiraceae bacterium]